MPKYRPLSPQSTQGLRWNRFRDYRHAEHQHLVPVVAPEVSKVAAELPLVFVKNAAGQTELMALLGLKAQVNHCLNEDFSWKPSYTPAFLRAHPFKMLPPKGGKPTERTLCLDVESNWVSDQGQEAFFDATSTEQPQLTSALQEIVQFLMELEKHLYLTQQAVQSLADLDLLKPLDLHTIQGQPIEGVLQVDEEKLNQLDDQKWLQLRRQGGVPLAYAQMISTQQLPRLKSWAKDFTQPEVAPELDLDQVFGEANDDLFKF